MNQKPSFYPLLEEAHTLGIRSTYGTTFLYVSQRRTKVPIKGATVATQERISPRTPWLAVQGASSATAIRTFSLEKSRVHPSIS